MDSQKSILRGLRLIYLALASISPLKFLTIGLNLKAFGMDDNQPEAGISSGKFTWTIESFSKKNTKKLESKSFEVGGCKWRIYVHPITKGVDHLSLCLKVSGAIPSVRWRKFAYFKLVLINHIDSQKSIVRETQQKFNSGYRCWGSSFLNLSDFYDPNQGYLMKNICMIEARLTVSDDPFKTATPSLSPCVSIARQTESTKPEDEGTERSYETLSSRSLESKWDQASLPESEETPSPKQVHFGIEKPSIEEAPSPEQVPFGIVIPPSEEIQSPKQACFEPTAPPFYPLYPPIYDDVSKEVPLIHLSEVLHINSFEQEEADFFPLLEEVYGVVCLINLKSVAKVLRHGLNITVQYDIRTMRQNQNVFSNLKAFGMDDNQPEAWISSGKCTWTIESFSKKNTKKLESKSFEVGGCKWRIYVHPINDGCGPFIIVFEETRQKFNFEYSCWKSSFVNLSDFYDPNQGYLMKNICIIEAHITVSDDPLKFHTAGPSQTN
ncbi:hypothetical protein RIF29_39544 [Crotalaria pallida]|uniref:MATH domain-containing protein n=1 Tax=Crotalaria pallida TaxID=3830 RepID=A0AAN9E4F3_CROPI